MLGIFIMAGGLIFFLIVVGVAAFHWGVDSRDGLESPEWQRRQDWFGR